MHNGYKDRDGHVVPRVDINHLPSLKRWFDDGDWNDKPEKGSNIHRLSVRTDKGDTPYNLRDCAYMDDFSQQKIIFPAIMSQGASFAKDNESYIIVAPGNIITGHIDFDKLLLYLHTVGYWALRHFYMGGGIEGELKVNRLLILPIPNSLNGINSLEDIYSILEFSDDEAKFISSSVK